MGTWVVINAGWYYSGHRIGGRWIVRRKAEVVAAVTGGLLSMDEACKRYNLTMEEFASWQRAVDRWGRAGLRVTRAQHYRDLYKRQKKLTPTCSARANRQRVAGRNLLMLYHYSSLKMT
jgi:hypothetical protein